MIPSLGQRFGYERTYTVEDLELFTRLSGDVGRHHLEPDADGKRMIQGLLTALLPTRIGGELDFISRHMHFEFLRPVFTGDTITTEVVTSERSEEERFWNFRFDFSCSNQHGKEVLKGYTTGVIRK